MELFSASMSAKVSLLFWLYIAAMPVAIAISSSVVQEGKKI